MNRLQNNELTPVFDIDLTAWLIYSGVSIEGVDNENGRIAFLFPNESVVARQSELVSGRCRVEPTRWSAIVRRIHSEWLSPAAKARLRALQDGGVSHE